MICGSLAIALLSSTLTADLPPSQAQEGEDYAVFAVSRLTCTIGNNKALGEHRAWYNGVFSMSSPDCPQTPFVPAYAGLNLENFYDSRPRHSDNAIFFEPRSAPMAFKRIDEHTAELYQPETPFYGIESWTRFELREPYYIDMTFTCVPHKPFEGGFFGIFWASYINEPENKSVYFLRSGSTLEKPVWEQFLTQQHDRDSTVRHESDTRDLPLDTTVPCLWTSLSPLRYAESFYYGRFQNMVLIYIFEPNPNIRFAHSPSGGGDTAAKDGSNPAWDFQYVVSDYEIGRKYGYRMRAVYKPWAGRDDVLKEVVAFRESLGIQK